MCKTKSYCGGSILLAAAVAITLTSAVQAVPTITLKAGVTNPPTSVNSTALTPQQIANADTATLVPVATFSAILQATLNKQGFNNNPNHWSLITNAVTLANNATFNITAYNLYPNGAGNAFGETINFALNPNPGAPAGTPAGSTVTEHWLQLINESQQFSAGSGPFGYAIAGQQGFWQLDNGDKAGGPAAGATTGPYYDSNGDTGFSVPPTFSDAPKYYSGVGTYLHFDAIPTWDVFTPAAGANPATESIDVGNYGLAWGFSIVPEPAPLALLAIAATGWLLLRRRRGGDENRGS